MPDDFKKKQPSKNERLMYDVIMQLDMMDRRMWTTSSFVSAVALLLDIKPEKLAELLTTGQDKLKDYSQKINDAIDKIEAEERAKQPKAGTETGAENHADHNHPHDHAHHDHDQGDASKVEPAV